MRRTSGSMLCPNCERLIGVAEPACPFCGTPRPGMFGFGPALQRSLGRLDLSTGIVAVCAVLYVLSLALVPAAIFHPRGLFDILAPAGGALDALGMTGRYAGAQGRWWTIFTAVFLHGSILHIFFNMMIMRQYLPNVSDLYGPVRAWVIFVVAGAAGFFVSNFASGAPTIGASGSIFGLLASLIVYGRKTGQHTVTQQLWTSAGVMFVYGFLMPSVNNWAHAGGFASGYLVAEAMATTRRRDSPAMLAFAGALTLAVAGGFVMEFVRLFGALRR